MRQTRWIDSTQRRMLYWQISERSEAFYSFYLWPCWKRKECVWAAFFVQSGGIWMDIFSIFLAVWKFFPDKCSVKTWSCNNTWSRKTIKRAWTPPLSAKDLSKSCWDHIGGNVFTHSAPKWWLNDIRRLGRSSRCDTLCLDVSWHGVALRDFCWVM